MSIRAVATRAGVSPATVSRVINGRGYVSDEARESVLTAITELDYRPNVHARRLRGVESKLIALLSDHVSHPFSAEIALAIDEIAQQRGYMVMMGNTLRESDRLQRYLNTFLASGVDGLVVVPPNDSPEVRAALQTITVPFVVLDQALPSLQADQVITDNRDGAYRLTAQLIQDGHRRVAFIGGNPRLRKGQERRAGYESALQDHGLLDTRLIRMGDFSDQSGFELTTAALAESSPDALFAANMDVQVGMLRAVHAAGLRVPGDITLGGFDRLPYAAQYSPVSIVVAQQTRTIGVIAAQLLIDKLEGRRRPTDSEVVVLQPQLMVRNGRTGAWSVVSQASGV